MKIINKSIEIHETIVIDDKEYSRHTEIFKVDTINEKKHISWLKYVTNPAMPQFPQQEYVKGEEYYFLEGKYKSIKRNEKLNKLGI